MYKNKFSNKSFTLLEILIYLTIFLLIITIFYSLINEFLKNYLASRSKIDLKSEISKIMLFLQQEALKSKSINILTDWEIVFNYPNNENLVFFKTSPVYFDYISSSLKGFASNYNIGSISFFGNGYSVKIFSSSSCAVSSSTIVSSTYAFEEFAWSPHIGWIKFRNSTDTEPVYGVCLDENNELRGYAWNDIVGYISFNCRDLDICNFLNYSVKKETKNQKDYLVGYAWNSVIGWIIFDKEGGKVYKAKLNPLLYEFDQISDSRVYFDDLKFEKIGKSIRVLIQARGPGNTYEKGETAISLPF